MKVKKIILNVIFLLSTIVGLIILVSIIEQVISENKECAEIENSILEFKNTVIKQEEKEEYNFSSTINDEYMDREFDWKEIKEINEDIIAWLYIPNTNIDYPVLQENEIGGEFYLHHDYKGDYLYAGSVFTPKEPYEEIEDAHMLLFAHRMKDKTIMFSSLNNYYSDTDTMLQNKYAYIYTEDKVERWIVWCTKNAKFNDEIYSLPYVLGSEQYKNLISNIKNTSNSILENEPTENDRTLVVSTCSGSAGGSDRFYVVFKIDEIKNVGR